MNKPEFKTMESLNRLRSFLCCVLILVSGSAFAFPLEPFSAHYEVSLLTGLRAEAEMTLEHSEETGFLLNTEARMYIFGKRVTTATASGKFTWEDEAIIPQNYEYIQTGLGKGSRSISYDWQTLQAETVVKGDEGALTLETGMLDELSMYMEMQQQAAAGVEDMYLNVIDEDKIKLYHYELVGDEQLETDLGIFNTVKYLRERGEDSKRKTELWFAKDWNYIVLKMAQKTSIRTFRINLREAFVNQVEVVPL